MENNSLSEILSSLRGVALLALFFGGSIFVHELGHFLAARWRKLKIERFSIGFGPKIFGWTGKDGVDYRVSWIPLGGYVALPQMGDSSAIEGDRIDADMFKKSDRFYYVCGCSYVYDLKKTKECPHCQKKTEIKPLYFPLKALWRFSVWAQPQTTPRSLFGPCAYRRSKRSCARHPRLNFPLRGSKGLPPRPRLFPMLAYP